MSLSLAHTVKANFDEAYNVELQILVGEFTSEEYHESFSSCLVRYHMLEGVNFRRTRVHFLGKYISGISQLKFEILFLMCCRLFLIPAGASPE